MTMPYPSAIGQNKNYINQSGMLGEEAFHSWEKPEVAATEGHLPTPLPAAEMGFLFPFMGSLGGGLQSC